MTNSEIKCKRKSKTGYRGVYKETNSESYRFSSNLVADPLLENKKRIFKTGFKTAEEAYQAKLAYEAKVKHDIETGYNRHRVGYLAQKYLEWRKGSVKLSTHRHDEDFLRKYLIEPYGNKTIREFCQDNVLDTFRRNVINGNLCTEYKNKIFKKISEVFEYGCLIDYVESQQANKVKVKTQKLIALEKKDKVDNYWTPEEWHKFLSTFKKNDKWLIFFTIFGQLGCRIGEMRGLMNKHVNFTNHTIRIEQQAQTGAARGSTIITSPKTRSSIRNVSIIDETLIKLKEYMRKRGCNEPNRFLFFNRVSPLGLNTIRRVFNRHSNMAKLKHITLHGIRHSNCTWLLSGNLTVQEIAQVSRRLGHSSTKMTLDIYMHIHEKESDEIGNILKRIF